MAAGIIEGFEKSYFIECLARFAVDEYNKRKNQLVLEFRMVLKAEQQLVAEGIIFHIAQEVFDRRIKRNEKREFEVLLKKELMGNPDGDA